MIAYKLIRSVRKSVSIHVEPDGSVVVRAPLTTGKDFIDSFVNSKSDWIQKTVEKMKLRSENRQDLALNANDVSRLKTQATAYLTERTDYFAEIMGVKYKKLRVNSANTRWGSCNSKGEINYTFRLILAPRDLVDYVVVHELAHLKEMNHSKKFWSIVSTVLPHYKQLQKQLTDWQRSMRIV